MRQRTIALAAAAVLTLPALTQAAEKPAFWLPGNGHMILSEISDNGLWAVSETAGEQEGDIKAAGGVLVDMTTKETYKIDHFLSWAGVSDVTDDGQIVVGEAMGQPAYWTRSDATWHILEMAPGWTAGRVERITPDGKWAVGMLQVSPEEWHYRPALWDMTTGQLVETPGMDTSDRNYKDENASKFCGISPDGRYILAHVSWFYPMTAMVKIYDREEDTTTVVGFNDTGSGYTPVAQYLWMNDFPNMSTNGEWVTGHAVLSGNIDGFEQEFSVPFRYHVPDGKYEVYYDGVADADKGGVTVLDDGTVLACSPALNPYRTGLVRHGNYWYTLDDIYDQLYGINVKADIGMEVSGSPYLATADGKTICFITSTSDNYVATFPITLQEACEQVNLLGKWVASPAEGSIFGSLSSLKVTFAYPIGTTGAARHLKLFDQEGNQLTTASNFDITDGTLTITFPQTKLEAGCNYTVRIPAGWVTMAGDTNVKAAEINITYTGRREGPVAVVDVYPADGASLPALDMTTNPIVITYDGDVALAEGVRSQLYRNDEAEPFCDLYMLSAGRQILLYPPVAQNLYLDVDYRVVVPEGAVTDISGQGASQEFELLYHGTFVRRGGDDEILFEDHGDNYDNFMFYEGDHRTPASVPAGWGFNADQYPWFVVRSGTSDTGENRALASHSMYVPAGQADDWMITPQLRIADDKCKLFFDAQSYLKNKEDHLKVYVLEYSNVVNLANDAFIKIFREQGVLLDDILLSPGESEEELENDWVTYNYDLAPWEGKDIYIAFVNDNDNQSAIFVDEVWVRRDLKYTMGFGNAQLVEAQESMPIKPQVQILTSVDTFASVNADLIDAQGNKVSNYTATGLELVKGDVYSFTFPEELPLAAGEINRYKVAMTLTDTKGKQSPLEVEGSVSNLTFTPVKRVVLEEFTGRTCPNCPQGIVAIEKLHEMYGEQFIPIAIKGYNGADPLGLPVMNYSNFLAMTAAPSGRINRGAPDSPMVVVNMDYRLTGAGVVDENGNPIKVWLDLVADEMGVPTFADIQATAVLDDNDGLVYVSADITSALNLSGQSLNLFAVLTEDHLLGMQQNGMYNVEDPDLGEWGAGGIYGKANVYPYYADHVARATYGKTFNGTANLLPSKLAADRNYHISINGAWPKTDNGEDLVEDINNCHMAVMLIDANTGLVVNSISVPVTRGSGVAGTNVATGVKVSALEGGRVAVAAPEGSVAEAYDLAGRRMAHAAVNGQAVLETGARGVAIVRVTTQQGTVARKVVLK